MSTVAPSVTVRRASTPDVEALLPLAVRFVADSQFAQAVPLDEESARATVLRCLLHGVVFVAEAQVPAAGRELETETRIVGGVVGEMRPVWHSRQPIPVQLGGFVNAGFEEHAKMLRDAFLLWAHKTQHARYAQWNGIVEKLP